MVLVLWLLELSFVVFKLSLVVFKRVLNFVVFKGHFVSDNVNVNV